MIEKVINNIKHEFALNKVKRDFRELFKDVFKWDLAIFAILPIVITILALFPDFTVNLRLNIHDWRWWQLLTASFVHINFKHYTDNISWFLILFVCQILIVSRLNIKKHYLNLFLLTILLFPIISSVIEIIVYPIKMPSIQFSMGSSGIISAFWGIGYSLVLFALTNKKWILDKYAYYIAITSIALSFLVIYRAQGNIIKPLIILLLFLMFCLYKYFENLKILAISLCEENKNNMFYFILLTFSLLFFFAAPRILFPTNSANEKGTVDLFVHYMGIIWGLSISYLYLNWKYKKRYLIAKNT